MCACSEQSRSRGAGLSREAWELEAPVDSCHVKVSKCKADVCGGPGRGARIYLGPESACDLRFIAFFQIHPFYNDGGPFLLGDLRGGSLPKNCSKAGLGVFWEKVSLRLRPTTPFTFTLFFKKKLFNMYVG